MNSACIVNYITMDSWRPFGQKRLKESLERVKFSGTVILLNDESLKCPRHRDIPYAFKLYAMKNAFEQGNTAVVWADASFWAVRKIEGLFNMVRDKKVLVQNSGYPLGQWTSDDCLKRMGIDRENAFTIKMFSGGLIGIDFTDERAELFFDEFYRYATEGHCFRGAWRNRNNEVSQDKRVKGHRHDMSVGSILMQKFNLEMQPNNSLFAYYSWYKTYEDRKDLSHLYFLCEGGPRKLPLKGKL